MELKVAFGVSAGTAIGAWVAGIAMGRKYANLDPTHAAAFGVATAVLSYMVHKGFAKFYGEKYKQLDLSLKVIATVCFATLLSGTLADDYFGVHIVIPAALKIMSLSAIGGAIGRWLTTSSAPGGEALMVGAHQGETETQ